MITAVFPVLYLESEEGVQWSANQYYLNLAPLLIILKEAAQGKNTKHKGIPTGCRQQMTSWDFRGFTVQQSAFETRRALLYADIKVFIERENVYISRDSVKALRLDHSLENDWHFFVKCRVWKQLHKDGINSTSYLPPTTLAIVKRVAGGKFWNTSLPARHMQLLLYANCLSICRHSRHTWSHRISFSFYFKQTFQFS